MTHKPHFKLKRMIVAVDFSEQSRNALYDAIELAKPFDAQIILLHVVEAIVFPPDVEVVELAVLARRLNEEAAKLLSEWRKEAAPQARVREDLRAGTPYREIVEAADEHNADLLVLGTHGRTGLSRLLIGSTAERVMRQAPCPVLVVRERGYGRAGHLRRALSIKVGRRRPPRLVTRRQVNEP